MQCPNCHQEMEVAKRSKSYNTKNNNKPYDKTLYVCRTDDIWITTDIPAQIESKDPVAPVSA